MTLSTSRATQEIPARSGAVVDCRRRPRPAWPAIGGPLGLDAWMPGLAPGLRCWVACRSRACRYPTPPVLARRRWRATLRRYRRARGLSWSWRRQSKRVRWSEVHRRRFYHCARQCQAWMRTWPVHGYKPLASPYQTNTAVVQLNGLSASSTSVKLAGSTVQKLVWRRRNCIGVHPASRLKNLLKLVGSSKPSCSAMLRTDQSV